MILPNDRPGLLPAQHAAQIIKGPLDPVCGLIAMGTAGDLDGVPTSILAT